MSSEAIMSLRDYALHGIIPLDYVVIDEEDEEDE